MSEQQCAQQSRRGGMAARLRSRVEGGLLAALTAVALMALPFGTAEAAAQEGTIMGQVVERGTLQPVRSAQVMIPALQIGTLTGPNGRYVIENVPAGTHTVQIQSLGYETTNQEITVVAGQEVELDFQIASRAVALDELVVTGAGVVQERRQLGQTIASISTADIEDAVATSMSELLSGRISGMTTAPMGEVGQSAPIVLRGVVSLSQRNDPVIYIDGIRMDNTHTTTGTTNLNRSPLNDINMADVERIEVIKGAAAATLYGTEASSGVIQITTRRGQEGAPQYNFEINQQASNLSDDKVPGNWRFDPSTGNIAYNHPASDFLRTGYRQEYSLSARGGSRAVQYYASARWADESGVMPVNSQENASLRTNLSFQHTENFSSEIGLGVTRNTNVAPAPAWGLMGEFVLANPLDITPLRPYGELFNTIGGALAEVHTFTNDHTTISARAAYRWRPNLRSEVRVGYNRVSEDLEMHTPPGVAIREIEGRRLIGERDRTAITLDASTSWDHDITPTIRSSFVLGGQSFWEESREYQTGVRGFASPGLGTLRGGASVYTVDEVMEEVVNAGFFVQEQIGFSNRLFLTAGLRMDGNSAFGEDFGLQAYPKFGASWVVSDHDFWNMDLRGWDHLRLRFAYGTSGLQPGAFDAQRTWQPVSRLGNDPAVYPLNLGNPDLKPERSTELEFGVEAEFFDGRLAADVVYWMQETDDALLQVPYPPSQGFLSTQLTNIGKLESSGIEVGLNVAAVRNPRFSWTLRPQFSTLSQEVTDMGGVAPFRVTGGRRWNMVAEGYSPGAKIAPVSDPNQPYRLSVPVEQLTSLGQITPNFLQNAAGQDSLVFIGESRPTFSGSLQSTFDIPGWNLNVRALLSGAGGYVMSNETELIRDAVGISERVAEFQRLLADPNTSAQERQRIADEYGNKHPTMISSWMEDADFLRFQELMVTYRVPDEMSGRIGVSSLQVSAGARNLALWTNYPGMNDPTSSTLTDPLVPNIDYYGQPYPRRFVFQIRGSW
jgi:TonB-dependent starch-binding outer membrane protein SusC